MSATREEFAARLRQLRLARGWSLDHLSEEIGGAVSKAALAKYETGQMRPSHRTLNLLSRAFAVKSAHILTPPRFTVRFVAYRKAAGLARKHQAQVESIVAESLESRVWLQSVVNETQSSALPVMDYAVESVDQAEEAAGRLRRLWQLGSDPLSNLVDTLEGHHVHVIEIDAPPKFDGISAYAVARPNTVKGAAVASRRGVCGERQRFNVAHELGHLVMRVAPNVDEEKAAHRFAAAFLAPAECVRSEVGERRSRVSIEELLLLKQRFGMSMQACAFRLKDLNVINESAFRNLFKIFSARGWRMQEPYEIQEERPNWMRKTVIRAVAEGLISREDAARLIGGELPMDVEPTPMRRKQFMKLPLEKRREILRQQAEQAAPVYEASSELSAIGGGDFLDEPEE